MSEITLYISDETGNICLKTKDATLRNRAVQMIRQNKKWNVSGIDSNSKTSAKVSWPGDRKTTKEEHTVTYYSEIFLQPQDDPRDFIKLIPQELQREFTDTDVKIAN